ncbi:hypothetical protein MRX96_009866 [Rhipicephalus microplus]
MDTSEALHRPSGTERRAIENTQEKEAMGLGALSERITKLEEVNARRDPSSTPLQVPAQRNVLEPPTEGAILRAAIAAQPSPQPKHG